MKNKLKGLLFAICALVLFACVEKKPEGPAELIGKGIDQMAEGFNKIDKDNRYGSQDPNSPNYRRPIARDDYERGRYDSYGHDRGDPRDLDRPDPYYDDSVRDDDSDRDRRQPKNPSYDDRRF